MQEFTREEMAAADPFGGSGIFLPAPGMERGKMLEVLSGCLGARVPAVAWDGIGVWIDHGSTGMNAVTIREQWAGGRGIEHG